MKIKVVILLLAVSTGICVFSACSKETDSRMTSQEKSFIQTTTSEETTSVENTLPSETESLFKDNDIQNRLDEGDIVCIDSGTSINLGWDEPKMISLNSDDQKSEYTLRIDDSEVTISIPQNHYLGDDKIYLVQIKGGIGGNETIFIVSCYGDSDMNFSTLFMCTGHGELVNLGSIESISGPQDGSWYVETVGYIHLLRVLSDGPLIWPFPFYQTYIVAESSNNMESSKYVLARIPEGMYPVGAILSSRKSVPIYSSRYSDTSIWTINPGEFVIFSATDNTDYLYIESLDGTKDGWLKIDKSDILIDGSPIGIGEVFDGGWSAG